MEVLTLLLFVGAFWILGAVTFFAWSLLSGNDQHTERLALLPLEDNWKDPFLTRKPNTQECADDHGK